MSDENKWKRDLEEVFRLHESRIESELQQMSHSFDTGTESLDIESMANFFEYISNRLVETCKKIEVNYFTKNGQTSNKVDVLSMKSNLNATEMQPTDNETDIKVNRKIKKEPAEEDGALKAKQLKIVDDNVSETNDMEKYTSNTINEFSLGDNNSCEIVENAQCDIANEIYSSKSELPQTGVVKVDALIEKRTHNQINQRNDIQKDDISLDCNAHVDELEEGEIVEDSTVKNIDPNINYAANRFACKLCNVVTKNVIEHYKEKHNFGELYVARPSQSIAEKIRQRTECFTFISSTKKIVGVCIFCETQRELLRAEWKEHLLYHTGETGTTWFEIDHRLMAFMCKLCNYIQIDQSRLTKHLMTEHEKLNEEIADCCEQVILIPNLKPLEPLLSNNAQKRIQYIDEEQRYKCGIGWCDTQCNNSVNLKAHLRQRHGDTAPVEPFGCLHCTEVIKSKGKSFLHDVFEHMNLHGKHLFWCLLCEAVFSREESAILHIIRNHSPKKLAFRHQYRNTSKSSSNMEEFHIILQCNRCSVVLYTIENATEHNKLRHKSLNIDFTVNKLIKSTSTAATTIKFVKNLMMLRQFFTCSLCDETRFNEMSLIKHFRNSHRMNSLIFMPGELFLEDIVATENNIRLNTIHMVFYCYYCYEKHHKFLGYANCQEVLIHWSSAHSKPFRFSVAGIAKCLYCDLMGTYQGLKLHQSEAHPNQTFSIVSLFKATKCALCQYTGDNLDKHFKQSHDLIDRANVLCPIPLTNKELKELSEMKGHKKRLCGYCRSVFETKDEFEKHHVSEHPSQNQKSEKFYDNKSIHLVADCCNEKLNPTDFFKHLNVHPFALKCNYCSFIATDLYQFIAHKVNLHSDMDITLIITEAVEQLHWETKVIFGNGLVLNNHNLLGTSMDNSETLEQFVQQIIQEKRESIY